MGRYPKTRFRGSILLEYVCYPPENPPRLCFFRRHRYMGGLLEVSRSSLCNSAARKVMTGGAKVISVQDLLTEILPQLARQIIQSLVYFIATIIRQIAIHGS